MKKVLLVLLVVSFACKNEKKTEVKEEKSEVVNEFALVKEFNNQDIAFWANTGTALIETTEMYANKEVYTLSRTSPDESSYLSTNPVAINYASNYRISVIVKRGEVGNLLGLRMLGTYPDRVDAVFDLQSGTLKEVKKTRDFEDESAEIEDLGEGWYKCTLTAEVAADFIRILLGPTTSEKSVLGWEGKTNEMGNVYVIPSSIVIEEVTQKVISN